MRSREEDYLDNLLNSLSGEKSKEEKTDKKKNSNLFRTPEDQFLKEFEAELDSEEYSDYIKAFEMELDSPDDEDEEEVVEDKQADPEPEYEIESKFNEDSGYHPQEEEIQTIEDNEDEFDLHSLIAGAKNHMDETAESIFEPVEGEEVDLSGHENSDLLDILSEDSSLSDFKDLLSGDELSDSQNEFEQFAQHEMNPEDDTDGSINLSSEENDSESKKGKKKKRKDKKEKQEKKDKSKTNDTSFLKKMGKLFFGAEEEQEGLEKSENAMPDIMELTAESMQILQEFEEVDSDSKKKKKKEKKPKKEKKEKEKKEKPPKEKKQKKEKPPKEVDNTPPLPKIPVILVFVMVFSLLALILIGTFGVGYQSKINMVQKCYSRGQYTIAYQEMDGLSVKQKDMDLCNKVQLLASVQSQYEAYDIFQEYGQYEMALDSLVCAAGRSNLHSEYAKETGCYDDLERLNQSIQSALDEDYQMSMEDAITIYQTADSDEYTKQIRNKIKALGLE